MFFSDEGTTLEMLDFALYFDLYEPYIVNFVFFFFIVNIIKFRGDICFVL